MTRERYEVDHSDPAFPRIRRCPDGDEEGKSFTQAKRRLIESIDYSLSHWREQMRLARALTKKTAETM
jgi:hypothetical protein